MNMSGFANVKFGRSVLDLKFRSLYECLIPTIVAKEGSIQVSKMGIGDWESQSSQKNPLKTTSFYNDNDF